MPATTTKAQTARTIRPYETEAYGFKLTVPAGALVSNSTACGPDNNYRFWVNYTDEITRQHPVKVFGRTVAPMMLSHDLNYYGLNIPAEYCEPYK